MTGTTPSFLTQIKSYPAQFWVANTMEIFERMSWYGWFTVMALYVTGSVETGGLGREERQPFAKLLFEGGARRTAGRTVKRDQCLG